jgi:integrase/recombinase XerD
LTYLHAYGYQGANTAHPKFVRTPTVPRDGKTVGIAPRDCRRLLDAPDPATPVGVRDRAIFALLAYTACRVGELATMNVEHVKTDGEHRVVEIHGKGRKERKGVIPIEARERLGDWIQVAKITRGPLFRPSKSPHGQGRDGFKDARLTVSRIEKLLQHYVTKLGLDPNITVHSFRVTATTRARELGVDILDLQEYLGHEDPRTTRSYIRDAEKLHRNPAYVLRY